MKNLHLLLTLSAMAALPSLVYATGPDDGDEASSSQPASSLGGASRRGPSVIRVSLPSSLAATLSSDALGDLVELLMDLQLLKKDVWTIPEATAPDNEAQWDALLRGVQQATKTSFSFEGGLIPTDRLQSLLGALQTKEDGVKHLRFENALSPDSFGDLVNFLKAPVAWTLKCLHIVGTRLTMPHLEGLKGALAGLPHWEILELRGRSS